MARPIRATAAAATVATLSLLAACGSSERAETRAEDQDVWSAPATFIDCDTPGIEPGCIGEGEEETYTSLDTTDVSKPWKLCVTVPHLKDPVWVASNYGSVSESQRLGVEMQFHDAGGYTGVTEQVKQVEDCTTQGADAIIVGAVSQDALNPAIAQAVAKGVVVVDAGNGVTAPEVQGRAIVDYYNMGHAVGEHLVEQGKPMKVALLPGPAGAGWSERSVVGFEEAIAGSQVEVVDKKYGDTAKEVQLGLVEDTMATHDDLDAIVGTAVTLDVAHGVLAQRGRAEDVSLYGTYLIPTTLDLIESGLATCAPTEQPVTTFKMSIDLAVRLLEGKPAREGFERMGPQPLMVCGPEAGDSANLDSFESTSSFAPDGWKPVTTVDAAAS